MTTTYNIDPITLLSTFQQRKTIRIKSVKKTINCHTDGSKLYDDKTGAGLLINNSQHDIAEEGIHIGTNATVVQAEVFTVGRESNNKKRFH